MGFVARGIGSLRGAAWVRRKPARVLPHVVDSVLLASAFAMLWMLHLAPTAAPWLVAKLVALFVYIGLGAVALRPMFSLPVRVVAWLAALATFAYIVSVAITKNPTGFLG